MKRLVALALPLVLFVAACGGSEGPDPAANPKDALVSAFENMSESDGLQIVLSLEADADSMMAMSEGSLAEEDAQKILDSSLTVRTRGQGEDAQFEMVANVAGEEDVTIKVVDKILYAQVDVEGLVETFGGDPSELDAAAQQAEAQGLGFVRNAIEGDWLAISGLDEFSKQFGGASGGEVTPDQQKLLNDMTEAVKESAEVTHEGSDDAGDHLVVGLPLRDLYEQLMPTIQGLAGAAPVGTLPPASEIPEGNLELDVWVQDDRVSQVVFDFVRIAQTFGGEDIPEGVESFGIKLELDEFGEDIEVPDDAVEVDGAQLMQTFMGGLMQGMSGTGAPAPSSSFDCSQLEGAPQEVIDQFADVCPGL